MKLWEDPLLAEEVVRDAQARREVQYPRESGLHVSDLIYCLRKSWYLRALEVNSGSPPELDLSTLTMFLAGHGHHALIEHGQTEVKVRLYLAGQVVHGTIDFIPPGSELPHEVKTTRASSKKSPESTAHYLDQLAAYVLAKFRTEGITEGVLLTLHLNGDGAGDRRPQLKAWRLEFTPDELRAWEQELETRVRLLTGPDLPPLDQHYAWECTYCPFGPQGDGRCPGGEGRVSFWTNDELPDWIG